MTPNEAVEKTIAEFMQKCVNYPFIGSQQYLPEPKPVHELVDWLRTTLSHYQTEKSEMVVEVLPFLKAYQPRSVRQCCLRTTLSHYQTGKSELVREILDNLTEDLPFLEKKIKTIAQKHGVTLTNE